MKKLIINILFLLLFAITPIMATEFETTPDCSGNNTGGIELTHFCFDAPNAPFTFTWEDENGTTIGMPTDVFDYTPGITSILDRPAGDYFLTIMDIDGCYVNHEFSILSCGSCTPSEFTSSVTATNGLCGPGAIFVEVSGGSGSFSYSWPHCPSCTGPSVGIVSTGTYSVTITDLCTGEEVIHDDISVGATGGLPYPPSYPGGAVAAINNVNTISEVRVYPTVYNAQANLEVKLTEDASVRIKATHYSGAYEEDLGNFSLPAGTNNIPVSTFQDPDGIYIYTVRKNDEDCPSPPKYDIGIKTAP